MLYLRDGCDRCLPSDWKNIREKFILWYISQSHNNIFSRKLIDTLQKKRKLTFSIIGKNKMTRKDFRIIAEVIRDLPFRDNFRDDPSRLEVATAFANRLEQQNPRFKRGTFLKTCGITMWSI